MTNRKVIAVFLISLIALAGRAVSESFDYFNDWQEIKNEGIPTTNYDALGKLLEKLAGAEKIFPAADYRMLKYTDQVIGLYLTNKGIEVNVYFDSRDNDTDKRKAVLSLDLPKATDLRNTMIFGKMSVTPNIWGGGHQESRVQLELMDTAGNMIRGPKTQISDEGKAYLILRPVMNEPIPWGNSDRNFNLRKVKGIRISFTIAKYPHGIKTMPIQGKFFLEDLYAFKNPKIIASLFKKPDMRRTTKDGLIPGYETRKLKWAKEKKEFLVGMNYPWENYGWDVGANPYGKPANSGWSSRTDKLEKDLRKMQEAGIKVVRVFLFCDFRTGLRYENGKLVGFDELVGKDIEALMETAGKTGIKLIPVLFDASIANGKGEGVGEHPELIFRSEKHEFLKKLVRPLLKDMAKWDKEHGNPIYALEIINEPEGMPVINIPGYFPALTSWMKDVANLIHHETHFKVTLGSFSIADMQRWWQKVDIDIQQFHFYKYMAKEHEESPLNRDRSQIPSENPIICGEIEAYDIENQIDELKAKGYDGVLFWSWNTDDGHKLQEKDKNSIKNWSDSNARLK